MKKRNRAPLVILVLLLGGAAAAYGVKSAGWIGGQEFEVLEGAPVRRGSLDITEVVKGNLEARNSVVLRSQIEGDATILFLEEEGKRVSEGDLVCELDVASLEDKLVEQEIAVNRARAELTKAEEQFAIQEIQNQTDVAEAQLAERFAIMDLEKYLGSDDSEGGEGIVGEWVHELQKLDETILLAEEELKAAEKELTFTRELVELDFAASNELEEDELAYNRKQVTVEQAKREKALTLKYAHERKLEELSQAVETKKRDVLKVERQARSRLADYQADVESATFTLQREQEKLAKLTDQVDKARLVAPVDGILVYARERSRWGSGDPIAEGTRVRERQEIITIPQPGGMVAKASVHETRLDKIQVGLPCLVRVDALPGSAFAGRVSFVAVLPDSGSFWANSNQREYRTEITLDEPDDSLRPGMSCNIEIRIASLEDVLYVPRQCVIFDGRTPICFVVGEDGKPARREVQVGMDNTTWVVVTEGLQEGEVVALSPPADFKPAPSDAYGVPGAGEDEAGAAGGGPAGARRPGGGEGRPSGGGMPDWNGDAGAMRPGGGGEGRGREGRRPSEGRPGGSDGSARPSGSGGAPSGGAPRGGDSRGGDSRGGSEDESR